MFFPMTDSTNTKRKLVRGSKLLMRPWGRYFGVYSKTRNNHKTHSSEHANRSSRQYINYLISSMGWVWGWGWGLGVGVGPRVAKAPELHIKNVPWSIHTYICIYILEFEGIYIFISVYKDIHICKYMYTQIHLSVDIHHSYQISSIIHFTIG